MSWGFSVANFFWVSSSAVHVMAPVMAGGPEKLLLSPLSSSRVWFIHLLQKLLEAEGSLRVPSFAPLFMEGKHGKKERNTKTVTGMGEFPTFSNPNESSPPLADTLWSPEVERAFPLLLKGLP